MSLIIRPQARVLTERLKEPRRFIQVVAGPRQVGKTTMVGQVLAKGDFPHISITADDPSLRDKAWLEAEWDRARLLAKDSGKGGAVLVVDEVQKIPRWSETVKKLYDADTASKLPLKVILLGSAPLLIQKGMTESLAGRFEIIHMSHWTFPEMREAFKWKAEDFVVYGGYPGSASLIPDFERWTRYIKDSLIETTISRDVFLLTRVDKPALLRRLFDLACHYSGQVLSYQKMTGQLQDAGNTTTLAHYLDLLAGAGMVTGLPKYSGAEVRSRASSPKLLVMNTALMTASFGLKPSEWKNRPEEYGRLFESAIGAHLLTAASSGACKVYYWREGNDEVDFVVETGRFVTAIEVKSSRRRGALSGLAAFAKAWKPGRKLVVGTEGVPLEDFLSKPALTWVSP